MKIPKQKDDALFNDIKNTAPEPGEFHLWWLGQSGYLIKWQNKHLLIDPYLSDSLTVKYSTTDKPHIRITELVIDPARLDFIDIATSSHNHTDHLDGETLIPLMKVNPDLKLVIPEANRDFVANRLKIDAAIPIGLTDGENAEIDGVEFHAVPAAHEELERDEAGRCKFLGYVIRFGKWTVYHSGDTMLYDGIVDILRRFQIDVALLPINGRAPERRVAGNLNAAEAVQLAKDIHAKIVFPCHYDMFTFNTADPQDFVTGAEQRRQAYCVLENGEGWSSQNLK